MAIGMPIISVAKRSRRCMMLYQLLNNLIFSFSDRKYSYLTISFQNTKNNNFTRCSPTAFSMPSASKRRLITLNFTSKWFRALFCNAQQLADNPKKFFNCFIRHTASKSKPINRNSQNKIFQQFLFITFGNPKHIPYAFESIFVLALTAFVSAIFKFPCPAIGTFWTLPFHNVLF